MNEVQNSRLNDVYCTLLIDQDYSASQSNSTILFVDDNLHSIRSSSGQVAQYIGERIEFNGGILQIIDRVLHLPTDTVSTLLELNSTYPAAAYVNTSLDAPKIGLWARTNEAFLKIGSMRILTLSGMSMGSRLYFAFGRSL